jgi:chromosomal replication initiation ATPase DnaA
MSEALRQHRAHIDRLKKMGGCVQVVKRVNIVAKAQADPLKIPDPVPILEETKNRRPFVETILQVVADQFKLTTEDLKSSQRTAQFVKPRQIAMYLAKTHTFRSYPDIGKRIGGRDHTTVLHGFKKMQRLKYCDVTIGEQIAAAEFMLHQMGWELDGYSSESKKAIYQTRDKHGRWSNAEPEYGFAYIGA